ncbi:NAD(P)-dependent alcohol dehydrogenase [Sphingobium sp. V4]|uniref:NAD(P)-dependent alcohol dehydrogenase n=1 Tax=Sphingobium sp. V4 TaxID=3038927 RepID=UPI002557FEDB|nr:NAD(P)-dependent alcohol dehydrogenase [Sphingobium sp. V4]WIW89464.1 NAD(P)-dependent alcohol dehydrogenase [Sphingobium sp. V4]
MKTLAAVVRSPGGPFLFEEHELEDPRADEVLVRIHATGICHTDIAVRDQHLPLPLPVILGHEGAGVVVKVGSEVQQIAPGDHVVLTADSCGHCPMCHSGHEPYCDQLRPLNITGLRGDGTSRIIDEAGLRGSFFGQSSFATYALATVRNTVKVPADIDMSILGQLGCGIQTGAGAVLKRLMPDPGSSILICGAGPVGIAAAMAARIAGCGTIAVMEKHPARLLAAGKFGATHVVDAQQGEAAFDELSALAPNGFDAVIDTTGVQALITRLVPLVAPLKTLLLLAPGATVTLPLSPMMAGGRTVSSHSCGHISSSVFIPELIELYRQGTFPIDQLVTTFPFSAIEEACRAAELGEVIKPVLVMDC